MLRTLRSVAEATTTSNDGGTVTARSQLIELTPFGIQITIGSPNNTSNATTTTTPSINQDTLSTLVANWMTSGLNESITEKNLIGYSTFQSVVLTPPPQRRSLTLLQDNTADVLAHDDKEDDMDLYRRLAQEQPPYQIVTVSYQLYSLWLQQSGQAILPTSILVGFEGQVLLDPYKKLLTALQAQNASTGLGPAVTNVWAYLRPSNNNNNNNGTAPTTPSNSNNNSNNKTDTQVIIIVAVVVAGVAFTVLLLATIWAWRKDRKRQRPFRRGSNGAGVDIDDDDDDHIVGTTDKNRTKKGESKRFNTSSPDGTGSSTLSPRGVSAAAAARIVSPPPSEIEQSDSGGGGPYEESLISEDISTSLSAYYRSGLAAATTHSNSTNTTSSNLPRTSDHLFGSTSSSYHNTNHQADRLNDAGSLSSMESYGYSLDGFNSLAGVSSIQAAPTSTSTLTNNSTTATTKDVMPSAREIRQVIDED